MPTEVTVCRGWVSAGVPAGTPPLIYLLSTIGCRLAAAAVAAEVDGVQVDLSRPLPDAREQPPRGRPRATRAVFVLRHSTAHVLAQAVRRLWPGRRLCLSRAGHSGRVLLPLRPSRCARFSDEDLVRSSPRCGRSWPRRSLSCAKEHTISEGLELFADQPYKREIIEGKLAEVAGLDDELAAQAGGVRAKSPPPTGPASSTSVAAPTYPRPTGWSTSSSPVLPGRWARGPPAPAAEGLDGTAWESEAALDSPLPGGLRLPGGPVRPSAAGAGARPRASRPRQHG